ncbi:D-Ala-D-Ala carboxypeptidase family metallohydrolase [uncultured Parasutterella sp.]|uniref:YcbK family protein n=1 Tax=uncultured Parasutterella sp. TaxID=1263098 RepID=UPI002599F441|nr:D-Ala-D-Ala carboxypeptidase family metallohydrolase [uncultured Parasutterella sp.]
MSKHFKPSEFESKDGRPSPWPEVVDPALYHLLEEIRADFGEPICINSGYRSPEHNAAVGGAKNSYHVKGQAADIRPQYSSDKEKWKSSLGRLKIIANRRCKGGVGFYSSFVHVDLGPERRWNG